MEELADIYELIAGPWIVVGDFNLLLNPEDKNNSHINRQMMVRFLAKLNTLELKEIYLNERRYTWSNERAQVTMEKTDHILSTSTWEELYTTCHLAALGSSVSDHCPLLLDLDAELCMGMRFKFESLWTKAEGFMQTVEEAWCSIPQEGNPYVVPGLKHRATT